MNKIFFLILSFFLTSCLLFNKEKERHFDSRFFQISNLDSLVLTANIATCKKCEEYPYHILHLDEDSLTELQGVCTNLKDFSIGTSSQAVCFVEIYGTKNVRNITNQVAIHFRKELVNGKKYAVEFELCSPVISCQPSWQGSDHVKTEFFVMTSSTYNLKPSDLTKEEVTHSFIYSFKDTLQRNWSKVRIEFVASEAQSKHDWIVITGGNSLGIGGCPFLIGILPETVSEVDSVLVNDTTVSLNRKDSISSTLKNLTLTGNSFESNKFSLSPKAKQKLDTIGNLLKQEKDIVIEIHGHTDNVGDSEENMELSKNRAIAVKSYLVGCGVDENRMKIYFHGDTKPISSNENEDGRAKNRRVEFKVSNQPR